MKYMYFNTSFSADMFYPCCGDDFVVQQVLIFTDAGTEHSNFIVFIIYFHIFPIAIEPQSFIFTNATRENSGNNFFTALFLCGFYYCYFLLSRYFPIIIQTSGFAALRLRWWRTFGFAKRLAAPHRPLAVGVLGPTRSNNKGASRLTKGA